MLMAYVRYVCEKVNRWCHCGYVKLFNVQTRWEQLRVNQNSWKTGDTIKRCRINVGLWGCGKRWQVLVWIIFSHSIFPTVLLISTHFSEEFLCQWICQHTGTHENAFRNPSFHHWQLLNVYLGYLENLNTFRVHHGWKKGYFFFFYNLQLQDIITGWRCWTDCSLQKYTDFVVGPQTHPQSYNLLLSVMELSWFESLW